MTQGFEIPRRRDARIDQHLLATQVGERLGQVGRRLQPHLVAEPGRQVRGHLGRVEEEARRAVGVEDRLADRQR
jgi:hypothetical protein